MIELFEQLDKFRDYKFYEEEHYYTYKGQRVSLSATRLIEEYSVPFDEDKWSVIKAKQNGITVQEQLDRWALTNLISQIKGTHIHKYLEDGIAHKYFMYPVNQVKEMFGYDPLESIWNIITYLIDDFLEEIKGRLIPIRSELVIGDPEFDIAGMIDQIFYNVKSRNIEIWDWKTNKEIKMTSDYTDSKGKVHKGTKMKGIMAAYDDCNFIHYSLQLHLYKYIIEKMTGIKLGDCRIVWFNENNNKYEVITCKDLSKEAAMILEQRRVKND